MIKKLPVLLLVSTSLLFGCQSKTGTGLIAGGLLGAGIGGIAGSGEGAVIGGAAGALVGGLAGAVLDEQEKNHLKNQNHQTYKRIDNAERLTVNDIINLSKAKIKDKKVIELIDKTNSHYTLNNYQVKKLKENDVSQKIIDYMLYYT